MQSSFRILPEGNGYLLAMASELLDAQLADLKKYAVFPPATLTDESAAWVRFGLTQGDAALNALGLATPTEAGATVRHDGLIAIGVSTGRGALGARRASRHRAPDPRHSPDRRQPQRLAVGPDPCRHRPGHGPHP